MLRISSTLPELKSLAQTLRPSQFQCRYRIYFAAESGSRRVVTGVNAPSLQIWQHLSQVRCPRSPAPVLYVLVRVARSPAGPTISPETLCTVNQAPQQIMRPAAPRTQ